MNIYESLLNKAINGGGSDVLATYTYTGTLAQLTPPTATELQSLISSATTFWDNVFQGNIDIWIFAQGSAVGMEDLVISPLPLVGYSADAGFYFYWTSVGLATTTDYQGSYMAYMGVQIRNEVPNQYYFDMTSAEIWLEDGTKISVLDYASQIPTVMQITVRKPAPSSANHIQTITGTLTECVRNFATSETDFNNIHSSLSTGDVSIRVEADASVLGLGDIVVPLWDIDSSYIGFGSAYWVGTELLSSFALTINYNVGEGANLNTYSSWDTTGTYTDLRPYADYIPTTITLYWHPMP